MNVLDLEAALFVSGDEGIPLDTLCRVFPEYTMDQIESRVQELIAICETSRPYNCIVRKAVVFLVTKPEHSLAISSVRKEVEKTPLTKAQIEVLSIIAYSNNPTKVEIDTLRGVNSVQPIKALLLRGMITRTGESHGSHMYTISTDALHSMGVTTPLELPEYTEIQNSLASHFGARP